MSKQNPQQQQVRSELQDDGKTCPNDNRKTTSLDNRQRSHVRASRTTGHIGKGASLPCGVVTVRGQVQLIKHKNNKQQSRHGTVSGRNTADKNKYNKNKKASMFNHLILNEDTQTLTTDSETGQSCLGSTKLQHCAIPNKLVCSMPEPVGGQSKKILQNLQQKQCDIEQDFTKADVGEKYDTPVVLQASKRSLLIPEVGNIANSNEKGAMELNEVDDALMKKKQRYCKNVEKRDEFDDCWLKKKQMITENVDKLTDLEDELLGQKQRSGKHGGEDMENMVVTRSEGSSVNGMDLDGRSAGEDLNTWRHAEKLVVELDNRALEESGIRHDGEQTSPKMLLLLDRTKTDSALGFATEKLDHPETADENKKYKPEIKDETDLGENRDREKGECYLEKEICNLEGDNEVEVSEERCGIESSWVDSDSLNSYSSYVPSVRSYQSDLPYIWECDSGYLSRECGPDAQWERQIGWMADAGYQHGYRPEYQPQYQSMEDIALYNLGGTFPQKYTSMMSSPSQWKAEELYNKAARYESRKEKEQLENDSEKDECENKLDEDMETVVMETLNDNEVDVMTDNKTECAILATTPMTDDMGTLPMDKSDPNADVVANVQCHYEMSSMGTMGGQHHGDKVMGTMGGQHHGDKVMGTMGGQHHGDKVMGTMGGQHCGDKVMRSVMVMKLKARPTKMMEYYPEGIFEELESRPGAPVKPDIPTPRLPRHGHTDVPHHGDHGGRRVVWLCGKSGRKCSDGGTHGGGHSGHRGSDGDSGGRRRGSDDHNHSHEHGNTGGNNDYNRGGDDYNNNYDNNNNNNTANNNNNNRDPARSPETIIQRVPQDFKRFRKKQHCGMSVEDWTMVLGELSLQPEGPVWSMENTSIRVCVSTCLEQPDTLADDMIACYVCLAVHSLLKHFANCQSTYNACTMCVPIFSLICIHVHDCMNNNIACQISLCQKISVQLGGRHISHHMQWFWNKVRKNLTRIIGDSIESSTYTSQARPERTSVVSIGAFAPSLPSIPETGTARASGSRPSSTARKVSPLGDVVESVEQKTTTGDFDSISRGDAEDLGKTMHDVPPTDDVIYSRIRSIDEDGSTSTLSVVQPAVRPRIRSIDEDGSTSTLSVVQPAVRSRSPGAQSLQIGTQRPVIQYPSLGDQPVGMKGIGEVVYSDKQQLVRVAKYWARLRLQYDTDQALPPHLREEGVILDELKEKLVTNKTRYSIDYQWVKVSHLGNGMSGKCHLATDFDTDFKFCVKEIHITKYEVEEVELLSELDHPNIVQMYGAIRHGEKIFILQEFIDGGCLTEAINSQRNLQRRLSHKTALHYFRQLLQVLVYLKSKHILNEDVKADNLLLCRETSSTSVTMKVTDFGLARRCDVRVRQGTAPVGTQTQWSPEKAESSEYGYPAELWAAVCVLVHMLSGYPPWIRRFAHVTSLIVVIVDNSPPLQDIPRNISECVRDLIERGLTVCAGQRPTAQQLLVHRAFNLLAEGPRDVLYSMLQLSIGAGPDNQLPENDENADLKKILEGLSMPENQADKQDGVQQPNSRPFMPPDSHVGRDNQCQTKSEQSYSLQSQHIEDYFKDELTEVCRPPEELAEYHTGPAGNDTASSSTEGNIDDEALDEKFLPKFDILQPEERSLNEDPDIQWQDETEPIDDDPLENFDLQTEIDKLQLHAIPTMVNSTNSTSSTGASVSGSETEERSIEKPSVNEPLSETSDLLVSTSDPEIAIVATNELAPLAFVKPPTFVFPHKYIGDDEKYRSINEDDLFVSGSPEPRDPTPPVPLQSPEVANNVTAGKTPDNPQAWMTDMANPVMQINPQFDHNWNPNAPRIPTDNSGMRSNIRMPTSGIGSRNTVFGNPFIHGRMPTRMTHHHVPRPRLLLPENRVLFNANLMNQDSRRPYSTGSWYPRPGEERFIPPQRSASTGNTLPGPGNTQHIPGPSNTWPQLLGVGVEPRSTRDSGRMPQSAGVTTTPGSSRAPYLQQSTNVAPSLFPNSNEDDLLFAPPGQQLDATQLYPDVQITVSQPRNTDIKPGSTVTKFEDVIYTRSESHLTKTHRSSSIPGRVPAEHTATQLPIQHSSPALRDTASSNPIDEQGFKRDKDRINEHLKTYLANTKLQDVPVIKSINSPNQSIGAPPEPPEQRRLRVDIPKATDRRDQHGPDTTQAQTAPVTSPPLTQTPSPGYERSVSMAVPRSPQTPGLSPNRRSQGSQSTSTPKSQYDMQEDLLKEFSQTAEDALSQHSESSHLLLSPDDTYADTDVNPTHDTDPPEFHLSSEELDPEQSLAHYFTDTDINDSSFKVEFCSRVNDVSISMKFSGKDATRSWLNVIEDELCRSPEINTTFGAERFLLRHEDGSIVNLLSDLGDKALTVFVEEGSEKDNWWVERGMINH